MSRHPSSRNGRAAARATRRTRAVLALLALAAALVTAPILAALAATPVPASSGAVMVHIGATLEPAAVTIAPGTVVTWHNQDGSRHRMRAHGGALEFDTGDIAAGAAASIAFSQEGIYTYMDHGGSGGTAYTGTVIVRAGATQPAPAPGGAPAPRPPSAASVSIAGSAFAQRSVTVAVGATVTWTNNDTRAHTVTAADNSFDSGIIARGATFQRTFTAAGTYNYLCAVHPEMTGTVLVTNGAVPPPPAPTPPPSTTPPPATPPPSAPPPSTGPNPSAASVSIANNAFGPASVTVRVGGTVTWTNNDTRAHTVTAADNSFDSGIVARGATFQRTFTAAGTYNYLCAVHPEMTGTVLVTNGAAPPPPATPPPAAKPPASTTPSAPATAPSGAGKPPAAASVSIANNAFAPASVTVAVGGTVTWTNNDTRAHTVTAADNTVDSGIVLKGATFKRTFASAGTYNYLCAVHPEMTATVLVTNGPPPPPAAAPKPASAAKGTGVTPAAATPASPGAASAASASVSMRGSAFAARTVTVRPGGTVTWMNDDSAPHTVTAADGSFDSGIVAVGGRYQRTFPSAGTFNYKCIFHAGMTGTVVVKETATAVAPPANPSVPTAAATGGSSGGSATPAGAGAVKASVKMLDNSFSPATLSVPAGSSVTFTNTGRVPHTATAADKSFDSGMVMPGGSWSTVLRTPGTYRYVCIVHPGMAGTITVTASQAAGAAAGSGGGTGTPGASGADATVSAMPAPSIDWSVALLVGGLVLLGGALFMAGLVLVERPGARRAAGRTWHAVTTPVRRTRRAVRHVPTRPRDRSKLRPQP